MFNGPVFNNETIQSNARAVNGGGISESLDEANALYSRLTGASFELVPSSFGRGVLYSGAPGVNGDLTWTRGGDAFRTNASGVIQRVPWNLLQQSETFENASWSKANTTISSNVITAPNGTLTADKLVATSSNSVHLAYQQLLVQIQTYTFSVYAKKGEYDYIILRLDNDIATIRTWFNLSNGTIGTSQGGSPTIQNVGDGWYRCTMTYSSPSVQNIFGVVLNANADNVQTFVGNGTSGVYIWGAQLVEGTTAQTYLPTTDRLNFPRLSYMYGSCPSALLEPQRTNLFLQSETFDSASWVKSNTSVTANQTTSPDGTSNADKLFETASNAFHTVYQLTSIGTGFLTSSCYAKSSERNWVVLAIFTGASGGDCLAWFDLSNGVVGSTTNGNGSSSTTSTIQSVGNGWYRCTITINKTSALAGNAGIGITTGNNVISYAGSTSNGIYIYGAQLEAGAYPTTYIPTTSATATRIADSFSRSNIYTNGLISASGGTWFVEFRGNTLITRDGFASLSLFQTSALTNSLIFFNGSNSSGDRIQIAKFVSGTPTTVYTTTTNTVKIAIKWNGTSADIFANGTKVVSATSFTTTQMDSLAASNGLQMFIQQMALFPTPLSDTDCASLTADYTDGTSIVGDYERYVSQRSGAVENLSGVTNLIQNLK